MFSAGRQITDQDIRTTTSTRVNSVSIGEIGFTADGKRKYIFAKAGGVDLAPGKITVNADVDSNVVDKTVAATVAAGATTVKLDAAGAVTADYYRDGYLTVNDATGEGITYLIAGNSSTSGAGELDVYLKEPLQVGLTVDVSEVTLMRDPWDAIVISIADQADFCTGVPNTTIDDADYGWVQVGGVCSVLFDEAVAKGLDLTIGSSTVGAVEALDAAGETLVGTAIMAGVDTEYQPAFLRI